MRRLFALTLILLAFISCEKQEDPLVRVKNDFDFYSGVELKRTDGYSKIIEDIDAKQTTDYIKIPSGFYIVSSDDVPSEASFQADKNKKYTITLYMTDKQIPTIKITE